MLKKYAWDCMRHHPQLAIPLAWRVKMHYIRLNLLIKNLRTQKYEGACLEYVWNSHACQAEIKSSAVSTARALWVAYHTLSHAQIQDYFLCTIYSWYQERLRYRTSFSSTSALITWALEQNYTGVRCQCIRQM